VQGGVGRERLGRGGGGEEARLAAAACQERHFWILRPGYRRICKGNRWFNMPLRALTSRSKQQQPTSAARFVSVPPDPPGSPDPPAAPPAAADELLDAEWTFWLWCGLSCLVAGLVDGASLAGVYHEATSHLSGISTKLALRLFDPPPPLTAALSPLASNLGMSLPFWGYILLVNTFGLGSLVCGFVLVDWGVQGQPRPHNMNVKLGRDMHAKHTGLIAACTALLSLSSLVIRFLDNRVCFFGDCSSPDAVQAQVVLSMTLASCCCGMLNGIASSSAAIIFRASHMTGTLTDVFLMVGFCVRTRALPRLQLGRLLVSEGGGVGW